MQEIAVDPGCQFLLLIYDETIQAGSYEWPAHHSLAAVALNYYAFYLFRGYWSNYHAWSAFVSSASAHCRQPARIVFRWRHQTWSYFADSRRSSILYVIGWCCSGPRFELVAADCRLGIGAFGLGGSPWRRGLGRCHGKLRLGSVDTCNRAHHLPLGLQSKGCSRQWRARLQVQPNLLYYWFGNRCHLNGFLNFDLRRATAYSPISLNC